MEIADISRIIYAFLGVLSLMAVSAFVAKKMGLAGGGMALNTRKRLSIVESTTLDARRRLVIVQCDGREHLLLLGPSQETVVMRNLPAREQSEAQDIPQTPSFGEAFKKLQRFSESVQKNDASPDAGSSNTVIGPVQTNGGLKTDHAATKDEDAAKTFQA